jgi:hypothetical protein
MVEQIAFFTPEPDAIPGLQDRLAQGDQDLEVGFMVGSDECDSLLDLEEVSLRPVSAIEVDGGRVVISGERSSTATLGHLVIDLSVEPPVAMYTEGPLA